MTYNTKACIFYICAHTYIHAYMRIYTYAYIQTGCTKGQPASHPRRLRHRRPAHDAQLADGVAYILQLPPQASFGIGTGIGTFVLAVCVLGGGREGYRVLGRALWRADARAALHLPHSHRAQSRGWYSYKYWHCYKCGYCYKY